MEAKLIKKYDTRIRQKISSHIDENSPFRGIHL